MVLVGVGLAVAAVASHAIVRGLHRRQIERRLESFDPIIARHAARRHLPPELVRAVIRIESGGRPDARSARDAVGLMQIREDTKRYVMDKLKAPDGDLADPEYNVAVGTGFLRILLDRFGGDVELALAAYNWGPANVNKLLRAHPEVASIELIDTYAPAVTATYCRGILEESGVPAVLTTSRPAR